MKTVSNGKQSVAWFRLAECVDRGEKEKALAFHRLLTHSYNDYAFIKKLEADILAFFQDTQASSNAYEEAATLYAKAERFFEAALIYEYLLVDMSDHQKAPFYRQKAVELFTHLGHEEKVCLYSKP